MLLYILLLLPLLQQQLHFLHPRPLDGDVRDAPDVEFTKTAWWDGTYQEKKAGYFNDNVGFRTLLVRINNQVDYSLFSRAHANEVVVGTGNYLYEKGYIDCYCGLNYPGDKDTRIRLIKTKLLQDTLQKLGKCLIVAHAPSKAWYYPDHFPPGTKCNAAAPSRYKDYLHLEDSLRINTIDFNAWFVSMRPTTKHLLMSKQSTHWTVYGSWIAADSLIKRSEQLLNIKMPHIAFSKITESDTPYSNDIDIAKGMNLLFPPEKEKFSYPEVKFISDSSTRKPNAIYMGDSFFWTLMYNHLPHNINNDWLFWYAWGDIVYKKDGKEGNTSADQYDWVTTLDKTDMVVLLSAEVDLDRIGNGFIEKAFDHYYPNRKL